MGRVSPDPGRPGWETLGPFSRRAGRGSRTRVPRPGSLSTSSSPPSSRARWRMECRPTPVRGSLVSKPRPSSGPRRRRVPLDAELHPDLPGIRVAPDVGQRLLDDANELPPARSADLRRQALRQGPSRSRRPAAGHAAVEGHQVLLSEERKDWLSVSLSRSSKMAPRNPSTERRSASAAPSRAGSSPNEARELHHLYLLQRVDDVLQDAVVQLAGDPVPLGLPDLAQRQLGPLALGHVVGDDAQDLAGHDTGWR